jgi:hypothetical protein
MATVARRYLLRTGVGETLLGSKLQILNGTGNRRPSIALSILTGRVAEQLSILENFYAGDPAVGPAPQVAPVVELRARRHYVAHTVYLSDRHLRDVDWIIDAVSTQQPEPRRLTRSAIVRRAVEHLRAAVEADPAKSLLENA